MPSFPRPKGKAKDIAYSVNGVPSNMPYSSKYEKRLEKSMKKSREMYENELQRVEQDSIYPF